MLCRLILWSGYWAGVQDNAFLVRAAAGRLGKTKGGKGRTNNVEQCGLGSYMNVEQNKRPIPDGKTAFSALHDDIKKHVLVKRKAAEKPPTDKIIDDAISPT